VQIEENIKMVIIHQFVFVVIPNKVHVEKVKIEILKQFAI